MDNLSYQIKNICKHNKDGSFKTQADRSRILQAFGKELRGELGFKLEKVHNLKEKHINAVVEQWKEKGLSPATVKNRMSALRWLAEKVDKPEVIPQLNKELGIENRQYLDNDRNRACDLTKEQVGKLGNERLRTSIELQRAFGLRKEEALKIRPEQADKGDRIVLQASWCKGGREREIPIRTQEQRDLLTRAKDLAEGKSMIPQDKSYKEWAKKYDNVTARHQIDGHGLRHAYAQDLYKSITGFSCAKSGGPEWKKMDQGQKEKAQEARLTVSKELGHNREEIANVYLGR